LQTFNHEVFRHDHESIMCDNDQTTTDSNKTMTLNDASTNRTSGHAGNTARAHALNGYKPNRIQNKKTKLTKIMQKQIIENCISQTIVNNKEQTKSNNHIGMTSRAHSPNP
jgi:hypothetical protein